MQPEDAYARPDGYMHQPVPPQPPAPAGESGAIAPARSGWERITSDLWLWALPTLFAVGALILAFVMLWIDQLVLNRSAQLQWFQLAGGPSEINTILLVIAGTSIVILALVYFSALVVLAIAAGRLGSLVVDRFLRTSLARLTLSMLIAVFVYCLVVLARGIGVFPHPAVPALSTELAILLAVASAGLVVAYVYHVATFIQPYRVAAMLTGDLWREVRRQQRAQVGEPPHLAPNETPDRATDQIRRDSDGEAAQVLARTTGYLQHVRYESLLRAAARQNTVIRLRYRPGEFVPAGSVLADISPATLASDGVVRAVRRAMILGSQRTLKQDPELAIDHLARVALFALSPSVQNTPDALICMDWLAQMLRMLSQSWVYQPAYRARGRDALVINPPHPFGRFVTTAFDRIRQTSANNLTATIHLLDTIARLAPWLTTMEQRDALAVQVDATVEGAMEAVQVLTDRTAILQSYVAACQALGRPVRDKRAQPRQTSPAPPTMRPLPQYDSSI